MRLRLNFRLLPPILFLLLTLNVVFHSNTESREHLLDRLMRFINLCGGLRYQVLLLSHIVLHDLYPRLIHWDEVVSEVLFNNIFL